MKILLDECVDRRLARDLVGHSVTTVPRQGWADIKNGELLLLAAKDFDVFLTVDRQIATQQDLTKFSVAVMLLRAPSNRLSDLRPPVGAILEGLKDASPGALTTVQKSAS